MTESKHTPGPWNSFNEFGARGGCFGADGVTLVAHLPNKLPGQTWRHPTPDEADANFRLIDAALDLLEALRAFVQPYEGLSGRQLQVAAERRTHTSISPHIASSVLAARAAIAKAEGR